MAHALANRDDYGYPTQPDSRRRLRNSAVHTSKRILLSGIYILMSVLGLYLRLSSGLRRKPALNPARFHPRHILVIRLDLIGDLVLSLPVVHTLKRTYPEAEIDLLALPSSAHVLGNDPTIHTVLTYDPNIWRRPKALLNPKNWREARALRQRLHERDYDLAVSVFGPWAALISLLSGAPRRLGFGKESYPGLMTDSVPGQHWEEGDHLHEVDYCLRLAEAAGATIQPEDRIPTLVVDQQARQDVEHLLQQEGISGEKTLIACHVSSNNGQSKRWPIPYWARLIDRLLQTGRYEVIFTGAPDDLPLIAAITARMRERAINMAGKTSLRQLAGLLQRADILVTGDSGPMHIACAVGSKVIAIHGPTDPAMSGPVSPHATVLRDPIWCSPCYKARGAPADCRFFTTQCMKNIPPEQVLQTIETLQSEQAGQPYSEEVALLEMPHKVEGIPHEQDLQ
ncbi:lipopolysaccharide heptosyltransferase II [Dictyobacter aurantiacus]|uniref:lipopolysaccharide heptosyltransferase II n=1 Tax=Dictyobacter aurantiacus TaxID=1936993 RepID=A0A401ZH32_9CHLR|nr:lipopolysaccharide heptosyltransferase II [Dictyobacter aurantiacus]GCE06177.1 ADP-heptose--LPS heptosyltransferase [Dictyobacter aurantiacus]